MTFFEYINLNLTSVYSDQERQKARKESDAERKKRKRATETAKKLISILLHGVLNDVVQQTNRKEKDKKRKALERANESEGEKNYRLDKDMENKRAKSQALFDQVYQWAKRRGTLKSSERKDIGP